MRKPLALAVLAVLLAATAWLGSIQPAQAADPCPQGGPCACTTLHGFPCEVLGATHACTTSDGYPSTCKCRQSGSLKKWGCLL